MEYHGIVEEKRGCNITLGALLAVFLIRLVSLGDHSIGYVVCVVDDGAHHTGIWMGVLDFPEDSE